MTFAVSKLKETHVFCPLKTIPGFFSTDPLQGAQGHSRVLAERVPGSFPLHTHTF